MGRYLKDLKVGFRRDICTPVFIAALFIISKKWKQPKRPSVDERMKEMWSAQTVEYCSALKRKEILSQAAARTHLRDIMLSETSQSQEDKPCMIPLT